MKIKKQLKSHPLDCRRKSIPIRSQKQNPQSISTKQLQQILHRHLRDTGQSIFQVMLQTAHMWPVKYDKHM